MKQYYPLIAVLSMTGAVVTCVLTGILLSVSVKKFPTFLVLSGLFAVAGLLITSVIFAAKAVWRKKSIWNYALLILCSLISLCLCAVVTEIFLS